MQCNMFVDWCCEDCAGPWQGEFMCRYCLQRKVVLIVETKFRVWRVLNVLNAIFPALFLQSFGLNS